MQSIDFNIFARIITEMIRKCFFCWSAKVARNGLGGREQQYKCKDCDRRFRADGKQELRQLSFIANRRNTGGVRCGARTHDT